MGIVTLDLPRPISVNRSRKIDWANLKKHEEWRKLADAMLMQSRQHRQHAILGPYEARIILPQDIRTDLDNCAKCLLDYVVRLKLVRNDSPTYLRKITIEIGDAPKGCQVILTSFQAKAPFVSGNKRRRIVEFLFDNPDGLSVKRLEELIYTNDSSRGGAHSIWVMVSKAQPQLRAQGWQITSTGGHGSIYRLERIKKAAPEEAA
jgi:hypothetical protein